ncbi:MAG: 2-oxo-4-hydroxy-4-carboxy-5-ureidoimidazoline decarboxylase [Caulobacteraceae bacterium]
MDASDPVLERADLAGRPVAAQDHDQFLAAYAHLFEHSPWVVERAWAYRPFADAKALHIAMLRVLAEASEDERLALALAHPELADKVAISHGLTDSSAEEQASAGLDRLSTDEYAVFHELNRAYRQRYGFPFIICVKLNDKASILAAMRWRLEHSREQELEEAMTQIGLIARLRLADIKVPLCRGHAMSSQLTTHALDIVLGRGAGGLKVAVSRVKPTAQALGEIELDAGGRAVLVSGEAFTPGVYELVFKVGDYHRMHNVIGGFLDEVPVRFGVADASHHCHVPLLISLYGYSTYRGG